MSASPLPVLMRSISDCHLPSLAQIELVPLPLWIIPKGSLVIELADICPAPIGDSNTTLFPSIIACIDYLERDYSTCGVTKENADDRFLNCARAAISEEIMNWALPTPTEQATTYLDYLKGVVDYLGNVNINSGYGMGAHNYQRGYEYNSNGQAAIRASEAKVNAALKIMEARADKGERPVGFDMPGVAGPGGSNSTTLHDWWMKSLVNLKLHDGLLGQEEVLAQLSQLFQCPHYAKLQMAACTCAPTLELSGGGSSKIGGAVVGCLAGSVGMEADSRSTNEAVDLVTVEERLSSLGYDGGNDLEHYMRLLQCATAGVTTFEDVCEAGIVPCQVRNASCPGSLVTSRWTCLRSDVPCALGLYKWGSLEMAWLRATNAPRWKAVPDRGTGFVLHGATESSGVKRPGMRWATDWTISILEEAGRLYEAIRVQRLDGANVEWPLGPITVASASAAEGGAVLDGREELQTGMSLFLLLPYFRIDAGSVSLGSPIAPPSIATSEPPPSTPTDQPSPPAPPPTSGYPTVTWAAEGLYDRQAAELQMQALADAGFAITFDDPFLCGLPCDLIAAASDGCNGGKRWRGRNLCTLPPPSTLPLDRMSYIIATTQVPPLGRAAPLILGVSTPTISAQSRRVMLPEGGGVQTTVDHTLMLNITGVDLGMSLEDVLVVKVGGIRCRSMHLSSDRATLSVKCAMDGEATTNQLASKGQRKGIQVAAGYWIRGLVLVTTASAGTGTSCAEIDVFATSNTSAADLTAADLRFAALAGEVSDAELLEKEGYDRDLRDFLFSVARPLLPLGRRLQLEDGTSEVGLSAWSPGNRTAFKALRVHRAQFYLVALDQAVAHFESSLPALVLTQPLSAVCEEARVLRSRIRGFIRHLAGIDGQTVGRSLYETAFNLTARIAAPATTNAHVRSVMARCLAAQVLQEDVTSGLAQPASLLQASARRLEALVAAMQAAWAMDDHARVFALAARVNRRRIQLQSRAQLASIVARAADAMQPAVRALTSALSHGSAVSSVVPPTTAKATCNFARTLGKFATRATAALPQLRQVAEPLGRLRVAAERVDAVVSVVDEAFTIGEPLKELMVSQVSNLLQLLMAHDPLGAVTRNATSLLKGLSDVVFSKLGGLVDRLFDFIGTLPSRMEGIADFLLKHLQRGLDILSIDDALKWVREQLSGKNFCKATGIIKKFAELAMTIIEGFISDGQLKQKLLDIVDGLRMVSSPADLLNTYIEPALEMLGSLAGHDGVGSAANQTFGPLLDWGRDRIYNEVSVLQEDAQEQIDNLVRTAANITDRMLNRLMDEAGQLGADLFLKLIPSEVPALVHKVAGWVRHGYETARFVHQLVNNTQPLTSMLQEMRGLDALACGSGQCDEADAPIAPDLSPIASSTASLFQAEGGLMGLSGVLSMISSTDATEQCAADGPCSRQITSGLALAAAQLSTFAHDQDAVLSLRSFTTWYATCGMEVAHRSKRFALPLQIVQNIVRSLTQPGGLLDKLKRGLCRSVLSTNRAREFHSAPPPLYDVPTWLSPHLCEAATSATQLAVDANAWLTSKADNVWAKILEVCDWAAETLGRIQDWSSAVMGRVNGRLEQVQQVAKDVLATYLLPVQDGLERVVKFVDTAQNAVAGGQRVVKGAITALEYVHLLGGAEDGLLVVLPDQLRGGGLGKVARALENAVRDSSDTSSCNAVYAPTELLGELREHWQKLQGFFAEMADGLTLGEVRKLPAALLKAFGGAVCFIRMVAASMLSAVDTGVDMVEGFMDRIRLGFYANAPFVDCGNEPYYCLVAVQRSTPLYYAFFFPVEHIQFWDLTAPPLIDPCTGTHGFRFRFTIPGLLSQYTLQASTFFKIGHTTLCGFVPQAYILTYQPAVFKERAPAACTPGEPILDNDGASLDPFSCEEPATAGISSCQGRASILVVTDAIGTVTSIQDVYVNELSKWSGSFTGVAVRQKKAFGFGAESDDGTVYVCGQGQEDGNFDVLRFSLSSVRRTSGNGIIVAQAVHSLPWLREAGAKRCTLSFAPGEDLLPDHLWVGAVVNEDHMENGEARAYQVRVWPLADGELAIANELGESQAEQRHLIYGAHVQGFAFFDDKLGNSHVALARCALNEALPCAIEFHFLRDADAFLKATIGSAELILPADGETEDCDPELEDSTCTLAMAVKVPAGIGSLAHDSSLNAIPHQYFHVSYIGMTKERFTTSMKLEMAPEDRIFLVRAPILRTTSPVLSKNWLQFQVLGNDLFEPRPLLKIDIDKDGEPDDPYSESGPPQPTDWSAYSGRRLSTQSRQLGRALGATRRGRMLQQSKCIDMEQRLLDEPYLWAPFMDKHKKGVDGFSFCIPVWPLPPVKVCGAITANVILDINIRGSICLKEKELSVALVPSATLVIKASIYINIVFAQAGIEANANLLTVQVEPELTFKLGGGFKIGFQLWLAKPKSTCYVNCFVDLVKLSWCGCCCPCTDWKRVGEWAIGEFSFGDDTRVPLLGDDSGDSDPCVALSCRNSSPIPRTHPHTL